MNASTPVYLRDRSSILRHLTSGLTVALASSQPATYPRSRWTGMDIACDELGVFESVHRLLSTTFVRFCARYASGTLRVQLLAMGATLQHYDGVALLALPPADGDEEQEPDEEHMDEPADVGGGGPGDGAPDQEAAGANDDSPQVNAKKRRLGMNLCRTGPLGPLVMIRTLMEPYAAIPHQAIQACIRGDCI